jgi:hypothetical protein
MKKALIVCAACIIPGGFIALAVWGILRRLKK